MLEAVAGEVRSDENGDLVIVTQKDNSSNGEVVKEMAALKVKLDNSNKNNSLLKDDYKRLKINWTTLTCSTKK